jgi:hypothetical protein
MTPYMSMAVPADFDDTDADAQVHPIGRLLFTAKTNAEVFDKARRWVSENNVFLVDVSWDFAGDESEPITLTIYFNFEI